MKDTKSILLLVVSSLLLAVSCVLLWTWGYRVYQVEKHKPEPVAQAPVKAEQPLPLADSLSVHRIDSIWNNADSLKSQLYGKLEEFNKLRNEINAILKNPAGQADLGNARQKINTLQQIVNDLKNRNQDIENENRRLQSALQQLSANMKAPVPVQTAKRAVYDEKQATPETQVAGPECSATELRLAAVKNETDEETAQAGQTQKLVGSFLVRNNTARNCNTELVVVIIQPDGQVLQGSAWESGMFSTPEGIKIYSYKLKVDLTGGESRRLLFNLSTEKYLPGNYTMQLYHNGALIGKSFKSLS